LSYRVPIFLSAWFGYVFLVTPTVATLESSTAREMCVTPCDAVGIVMAQSSVMPSIDEINREIEALAVAGEAKPIPEDVLRRWLPSDDLDDNAAMLRALGFNVQVHDVERDAHPLRGNRKARRHEAASYSTKNPQDFDKRAGGRTPPRELSHSSWSPLVSASSRTVEG
jgi:hypothetical protein